MITQKEESLIKCLNKVGLRELPPALEKGSADSFLTAIVLTKRMNGTEAYCYAENDGDNKPTIKIDYGPSIGIVEIVSVHPVQRIDSRVVPYLRNDEEIVQYLCKNRYNKDDIEKMLDDTNKTSDMIKKDRATVRSYILKTAIELQKLKVQEEERVEEIKNYSKRIKNGKSKKEKTDD